MGNTLYTALINANDGVHIYRKSVPDDHGAYEDFEYEVQNKAADMDGELFGPYAPEDVVEDVTLE